MLFNNPVLNNEIKCIKTLQDKNEQETLGTVMQGCGITQPCHLKTTMVHKFINKCINKLVPDYLADN